MLDPEQARGGCLRNLGIHGADAVAQLAGDEPVTVRCVSVSHADSHLAVETYGVAALSFGSSSVATIEAGYNHPHHGGSDYEWRVSTHQKYVVNQDDRLLIGDAGGERFVPSSSSAERYDAFVRMGLENLRTSRPPLANLWDCYRAARIIDNVCRAAGQDPRSGRASSSTSST